MVAKKGALAAFCICVPLLLGKRLSSPPVTLCILMNSFAFKSALEPYCVMWPCLSPSKAGPHLVKYFLENFNQNVLKVKKEAFGLERFFFCFWECPSTLGITFHRFTDVCLHSSGEVNKIHYCAMYSESVIPLPKGSPVLESFLFYY